MRPDEPEHEQGQAAHQNPGDGSRGRAQLRALGVAGVAGEEPLGQLPEGFAEGGIARLDDDGVQRPEILFGRAEQRAPAEPANAR